MVVSKTQESAWLQLLRDLPALHPLPQNLLVIAPHPDDETLACGGLIAARRANSIAVRVVSVTDGENAYPDAPGLAAIRREEQTEALRRLGVEPEDIVRLRLPDSDVGAHHTELVASILPLITSSTHILAPWTGDFHPDHEACGRAAIEAARRTGAALTFWLFWTWHRGEPDTIAHLQLRFFPLTDEQLRAKSEALLYHRSQLFRDHGDPVLPENLLAPARRPFEVFIVPTTPLPSS